MKKRTRPSFVVVLPAVAALSACSLYRTSNPPPPENPPEPTRNPPAPPELLLPPVSYGPREKIGDSCYVSMSGNPPMNRPVSCSAPIEPPQNGSPWCEVATAEDPAKKFPVECPPKP
jgi:hypothetical protein